jgi:hypothetical protein
MAGVPHFLHCRLLRASGTNTIEDETGVVAIPGGGINGRFSGLENATNYHVGDLS